MKTEAKTKPVTPTRYVAIYRHEDSPKHTMEYEFTSVDIHTVRTDPAEWATTWCPKGYYLDDLIEVVASPWETRLQKAWDVTVHVLGYVMVLLMFVFFGFALAFCTLTPSP